MENHSTPDWLDAIPTFEHPPAPVRTAKPYALIPTAAGHVRLNANSDVLRDAAEQALLDLANREGFNRLLRSHNVVPHPLPANVLITGPRGSGKHHLVKQYAANRSAQMVTVNGGALTADLIREDRESLLCVERLDEFAGNQNLPAIIAALAKHQGKTAVAFVGDAAHARRVFKRSPDFARHLAFEIQLPAFDAEELLDVFRARITSTGRHPTGRALHRAFEYLTSLHQPNAHDAVHFADQAVAAQYRRLFVERGTDFATEAELVRWADVGACIPDTPEMPGARAQLDAMVGLDSVKEQIYGLVNQASLNRERARQGLPVVNPSLHMAFVGGPGTGKTEVARRVAKLLREENVISRGHLIERSRADLVGNHVGSTAPRVRSALEAARGGVLFIDEAYALTPHHERDFGHEALATLIQGMEDYRDDLVVILAGYTAEMEQLLDVNPGLRSRVNTTIAFPDYSEPELLAIVQQMAAAHGYTLGEGVAEELLLRAGFAKLKPSFGNARWARNVFESAVRRQSSRITGTTWADINALLFEDFQGAGDAHGAASDGDSDGNSEGPADPESPGEHP